MFARYAPTTTLLTGLAILAGCDLGTSPDEPASTFLLVESMTPIENGGTSMGVSAGGLFLAHRGGAKIDGGTAAPDNYALKVNSRDGDRNTHFNFEFLNIRVWEIGLGSYELEPIAPLPVGRPGTVGVSALYVVDGSHYISESGTVTITGFRLGKPLPGDEHRMEGTFEVTLAFLCRPSVNRDQCWVIPDSFPEYIPRLTVTGTFAAESDSRSVPPLIGTGSGT